MTGDLSLEHQVALLPKEQQDEILKDVNLEALQYDWNWNARPSQKLSLEDAWALALALAGRGWGKTLTGSQWLRELDRKWETLERDSGKMRFALLGRTAADVRDVMIEGPSGIMNIYPPSMRDKIIWTPTRRSLTLPNGSQGLVFSSEEPDQLRGPAFHCFPSGTMIRTSQGSVPIEKVCPGDLVWTRRGLRPVSVTSSSEAEVLTLSHAKGVLRGTPDHPVLTQRGWVPLHLVGPSDTLTGWMNGSGRSTIGGGLTVNETVRRSNGDPIQRGRLYMDPFRKGSRFTTLISTDSTTTRATSSHSLRTITKLSIERRWSPGHVSDVGLISISMPWVVTPSTANTAEKSWIRNNNRLQITTDPRTLQFVSTAGVNFAPAVADIAVNDVSTSGPVTLVYNLMVEEVPEFFADDILVHNCGWADEMASYKQVKSMAEGNLTAWENLRIAVRLGSQPQILATTTPKRVPVLKAVLDEAKDNPKKILLRRGKTLDNAKLSSGYLDTLLGLYGGTQLGKQELEGEMLDDVVGAMTSEQLINAYRVDGVPKGVPWIKVIGVDPSVAERPHDECGIVVVYISNTWPILKRHAFVVDDLSQRCSPTVWGDIVVKAAHEHGALVVAEVNQGANLVKQMVRQSAAAAGLQNPPIREVWSSKSKSVRSEPVGGAYSRGRIHHVNVLAELEEQCFSWVPGESGYSPDRMDALVHACAAGMFPEALIHGSPGSVVLHNVANQRIPLTRETSMPQRWGAAR